MDRTTHNQTIPPAGRADLSDLSDEQWLERLRKVDRPVALGRLGPYELLAEVSRGVQGVVSRARQPNTERVIALKRLIAGTYATPASRARFEREIQTELALRHPNIVTVYGVELVDGQPLLAMEWIDGVPVDRYVQQSPAVPGRVTPREDTRARLELFLKIAAAVHHAHQRGVIHRDLKPTNILVDAVGEPHVLDFGLAKFTSPRAVPVDGGQAGETDDSDLARLTGTRDFLGTPAYAAPEQVRGEHAAVDVRTDVYALGVILYQMLTGRLPFPADGNLVALLDAIRQTEPVPPSRIIGEHGPLARPSRRAGPRWWLRGLRGVLTGRRPMLRVTGRRPMPPIDAELDAIVLKALAKEPDARYPSVDAFAADVRRYLAGEPIEAQRASPWYVLRKLLRRYRFPVAFAATIALLLVGATAVSLRFWQQAEVNATAAEANATKAERQAEETELAATLLADLIGKADPHQPPLPNEAMRQRLDDFAASFEPRLAGHPDVKARVHLALGGAYRVIGEPDRAEPHLIRALTMYRELYGPEHPKVAAAIYEWANSLHEKAEFSGAEATHREALAMRRRLLGDVQLDVAVSLSSLGEVLWHRGDLPGSEAALRESLAIVEKLDGSESSRATDTFMYLFRTLAAAGRMEEAESVGNRYIALTRKIYGNEDPRTGRALTEIGKRMATGGVGAVFFGLPLRFPEGSANKGLALLHEGIQILERVYPDGHPQVTWAYRDLGNVLVALGRPSEALPEYQAALEMSQRLYNRDNLDVVYSLGNVAGCLQGLGRAAEAWPKFEAALEMAQRLFSGDHPEVAAALSNPVECLISLGRPQDALPKAEAALAMNRRLHEGDHTRIASSLHNVALCLASLGRSAEAMPLFEAALEMNRHLLPEGHLGIAHAIAPLAEVLLDQADFAKAEPLLRECLAIRREKAPPEHWLRFDTMNMLGGDLAGQAQDPALALGARIAKLEEAEPLIVESYAWLSANPERIGPAFYVKRVREAGERVVKLYETWDAVQPDSGYAEKAAEWRARLNAADATPTSAPAP